MSLLYSPQVSNFPRIEETASVAANLSLPTRASRAVLPKIVSLFSGAGGLDLGFKQAGFTVAVAIDVSASAMRTHRNNFPRTKAVVADLTKLKPCGVLDIVKGKIPIGGRIGVIGGPPCQGFSRANSGSKPTDPRNNLPALYLGIVEELKRFYTVELIVFENVLGIKDKKHQHTYESFSNEILKLGFSLSEREMCATEYGVPQRRRRVVVCGLRGDQGYSEFCPRRRNGPLTVREAIQELPEPVFFKRGLTKNEIPLHPNHWTMQPKSQRFKNPELYKGSSRSFKRLRWDAPSPTIAYGHREIHVHPNGKRRLSIYEALLLQGFPKDFVLEGNLSEQVEQVSNAVPPPLARSIALAVRRSLCERVL